MAFVRDHPVSDVCFADRAEFQLAAMFLADVG